MEYIKEPPCHCFAIASHLLRNGRYEAVVHKSSRLVFQEVSDLYRATTPKLVNISESFSQREFTAALQHLKPGKVPGPDFIFLELIIHARAALKSWLREFLSFCFAPTQNFQELEKSVCSYNPKADETCGETKELSTNISALCLLQDPQEAYRIRVEPSIDSLLPKEEAGFRQLGTLG